MGNFPVQHPQSWHSGDFYSSVDSGNLKSLLGIGRRGPFEWLWNSVWGLEFRSLLHWFRYLWTMWQGSVFVIVYVRRSKLIATISTTWTNVQDVTCCGEVNSYRHWSRRVRSASYTLSPMLSFHSIGGRIRIALAWDCRQCHLSSSKSAMLLTSLCSFIESWLWPNGLWIWRRREKSRAKDKH